MNHGEEEYVMSQHLLVASDKYNLERLKFICQQNLCKHIEASNVTFILELAEQHQCHALKNACFEFLSTPAHLEVALATDSFKCMSRNCPSIMMELVAKLGTQAAKPSNISSFPQFYYFSVVGSIFSPDFILYIQQIRPYLIIKRLYMPAVQNWFDFSVFLYITIYGRSR
jgi:hypothetical protein